MKPITEVFPFPKLKTLELSNSSLGSFHSCPRKLEFRKIYNNSRKQESLAMGTGTALHAGIQEWLQSFDEEKAIWEMIKRFPIKYQKSWSEQRSLVACYQSLVAMMQWEKINEFELAQIYKPDGTLVPGVEMGFILRIGNYPFYPDGTTITVDYLGFIDLILYNKIEDEYLVWDIKTTTKDIDHNYEFQFAEQTVPYGLVLESILGRDINNGFETGYWSVYVDPLKPKNLIYPYYKTKTDLQDWMQSYLFDLDAIRRYYNLGWFARRGSSCMSWNQPCAFFDFCETRDPRTIEQMLDLDSENQSPYERPKPWMVIELDYAEVV